MFGHSFVPRLASYISHEHGSFHNKELEYTFKEVSIKGYGGLAIDQVRYTKLAVIHHFQPDVCTCYIELGTNDLADRMMSPKILAANLHDFANDIFGICATQVAIGQVIEKTPLGIPVDVPNFNDRVHIFNKIAAPLFHLDVTPDCYSWKHTGLWFSQFPMIDQGGIHLTQTGLRKYFRSIRVAILQATNRACYTLWA
jgi:hypothetical protein